MGLLPPAWKSIIHVNRVGLVPKRRNSGTFRMITNLLFPHGAIVNDGISPDLTSLSYITVTTPRSSARAGNKEGSTRDEDGQ